MKKTFIVGNGITVEGEVIYTSSYYHNNYGYICYDIIIYTQNSLVKITYSGDDCKDIEILQDYVVIPPLE